MTTAKREARTEAIYLRLAPAELERLDAIAALYPNMTRSGVAREAMRVGLDAIERDRITPTVPKRKRKGRRA